MYTRRKILEWGLYGVAGLALNATAGALAGVADGPQKNKLVVFILRGAMDGMAAVAPFGDASYAAARADLAFSREQLLPLNNFYGFNPGLKTMADLYQQKEALVFHAVATSYRDRSHFDAQNLLENGTSQPFGAESGWLNRALKERDGHIEAVALSPSLPLLLRGKAEAENWYPSTRPEPAEDTLARVKTLLAPDKQLSELLTQTQMLGTDSMGGAHAASLEYPKLLARKAATLLCGKADCVVLEATGWDTHANQGLADGQLCKRLTMLDSMMAELKTGMGNCWAKTAVLVVTEFGRTVRPNGSAGTDHGTGTVAFLLGGAVAGGRVVADWPGLREADLWEGRDLKPTTDVREICAATLCQHFGVSVASLPTIFPGFQYQGSLKGLFRTS